MDITATAETELYKAVEYVLWSDSDLLKQKDWLKVCRGVDMEIPVPIACDEQLKAGMAIAKSVMSGFGGPRSILVFGIPGTGKTAFAMSLANCLKEQLGLDFNFVAISCDQIPIESGKPEEIVAKLNAVIKSAEKSRPTLICFDEIDSLSPIVTEIPSTTALFTAWMRRLLSYEISKTRNILMVCTTNYPSHIDFSVRRRFDTMFYIQPTPLDVIKRIIVEELGEGSLSEEVADRYVRAFKRLRLHPMCASVVTACNLLKERYPDLSGLTRDSIVDALMANTSLPPSVEEIDHFESENADLIRNCRSHTHYWKDMYNSITRKEKPLPLSPDKAR